MSDISETLGQVALFSTVPKRDLQALAKTAHEVTYEPGTSLSSKDDFGSTFYVVVDGEADVVVNKEIRRRLGPGDYFGEMAIIDRAPRSSDVVAVSSLRCLVFTRWTFRPFLKDRPDVAWALLELLVRRLREAEEKGGDEEARLS